MIDFSLLIHLVASDSSISEDLSAIKTDLEFHKLHQATNRIARLLKQTNYRSDIFDAVVNKLIREIDPVRFLTFIIKDVELNKKGLSSIEKITYIDSQLDILVTRPGAPIDLLRLIGALACLPFSSIPSQEKLEHLTPLRKEFLHYQRMSEPLTPYIEFQLLKTSIVVFQDLDRPDDVFSHAVRLVRLLQNLDSGTVYSLGDIVLTPIEHDALVITMARSAIASQAVFDEPVFDEEIVVQTLDRINPHIQSTLEMMSQGRVVDFREMIKNPTFLEAIGGDNIVSHILTKIQAMAFVLLVMRVGGRRVALSEVALATGVPREEAEYVVLKAFANNIAEGYIDGVSDDVIVSKTSSRRVKTSDEVGSLRIALEEWSERIANVAKSLFD